MLTFGSLERDLSRVSRVPSPRPWSRRGSVCPSAKPGTVGTGMPRDATGCHGQKPEDLGFLGFSGESAEFLGPWDRTCHDLP